MLPRIAEVNVLYGIERVRVAPTLDSLTVDYDATRLRPAEVESALAAAGIPSPRNWPETEGGPCRFPCTFDVFAASTGLMTIEAHEARTVLRASLTGVLFFTLGTAFGQPEARPAFEVASVKRNASSERPDFAPRRSGTLVMMHNTQVGSFIFYAYHLEASYQLAGIPDWPDDSRWFDIDARTAVPDARTIRFV